MDTRELKALEIAARVRLVWEGKVCTVPSQSGSGESYKVERTLYGYTCTCEDYELRRQDCKHVIAARLVWEREHGEKAPEIDTGRRAAEEKGVRAGLVVLQRSRHHGETPLPRTAGRSDPGHPHRPAHLQARPPQGAADGRSLRRRVQGL